MNGQFYEPKAPEMFNEQQAFGLGPELWPEETEPELFCEDGHLSDAGLRALIGGQLDELGRLEAAEHLGFCSACLERYTQLLTADALQKPEKDLAPAVARRLRQKTVRINLRRYAAAAAAAAVALTLWGSGIFQQMTPQGDELLRPQPAAEPVRIEVPGAGVSGFVNGVLGAAGEFCGGLFSRETRPAAPDERQPQPAGEETPQDTRRPDAAGAGDAQNAQRPDAASRPGAGGDERTSDGRQHARGADALSQKPERTPATAMRGEE